MDKFRRNENVISSTELAIHSISGNSSGDYAKETGLVKEITNWRPNRQYIVTFDYLTYGDDFIFKFYERRREGIKANSFFEKASILRVGKYTSLFLLPTQVHWAGIFIFWQILAK